MYRKTSVITLFSLFFLIVSPVISFASTVNLSYFGTTSETNYLWADSTYGDDQFTRVDYVSNSSNARIEWYRLVGSTATYISATNVGSGSGSVTPPGDAAALKLVSNDGGEIYLKYAESTNPNSRYIHFEPGGDSGGNDGGNDGGGVPGNSGDCGCIFNTPGWGDYMGKIDEIIGAIPPPPNWGQVANTFRDSIVPKLIGDLSGLLGSAPSLPSKPNMPGGLDDGNLKKPTGKEDPNLKGFTSDDIKNQAPKIEENEDPTGGWDILDPIGQLPSQDEFKDNIPEEGDMIPPEVPDVEGEAPNPPEQENQAPSDPKEEENTAPKPPEQENNAPGAPNEGTNTAPTPPEQSNPAPGAPNDDGNFAPQPGDSDGSTAPIPGDTTDRPPTPNESGTAPIPGGGGGQAPIPGSNNSTAPIPGR